MKRPSKRPSKPVAKRPVGRPRRTTPLVTEGMRYVEAMPAQTQRGERKQTGRGAGGGRRPKYDWTDPSVLLQVEKLAGLGLTLKKIGHVLGVSDKTLIENKKIYSEFASAIERGKSKAEGIVAQSLFTKAKAGDMHAIRWWEMTRAGRTAKTEISGKTTQYVIQGPEISDPSEEEWEQEFGDSSAAD